MDNHPPSLSKTALDRLSILLGVLLPGRRLRLFLTGRARYQKAKALIFRFCPAITGNPNVISYTLYPYQYNVFTICTNLNVSKPLGFAHQGETVTLWTV